MNVNQQKPKYLLFIYDAYYNYYDYKMKLIEYTYIKSDF